MPKEFNPEIAEYKIVSVPLVAYTSVRVKVPIDFDLETRESEEYPDFWISEPISEYAYSYAPDWEISEDEPLELEED